MLLAIVIANEIRQEKSNKRQEIFERENEFSLFGHDTIDFNKKNHRINLKTVYVVMNYKSYMYVCIYMETYTYVCIKICIYTHIYTHMHKYKISNSK